MLVPIEADETQKPLFGFACGTVRIHGDIVAPLDVEREAQQ